MIKFAAEPFNTKHKTTIVFAGKGGKLLANASKMDPSKGFAKLAKVGRFSGKVGEMLTQTEKDKQTILVALGDEPAKMQIKDWRNTGVLIGKMLDAKGVEEACIALEEIAKAETSQEEAATALVEGISIAAYRFDQFRTLQKETQKAKLKSVFLGTTETAAKTINSGLKNALATMEGAELARNLVNLPPNIATPTLMVEEAKKLGKLAGMEVKILGEKEMKKLGMGLLLAVGQGSVEESRLIILKYTGAGKKEPYKALAGKGVMFDTGGYNLKPGNSMAAMKTDMGGAAAVMGAMKALAKRKAKVNVVAVCGCVMNMVASNAFLPSDVLTSYKGQTVEIGNTDAEGRLVLADAMAYIIDQEKPTEIIDLATLTGACMVALGGWYAGLFSTSDAIANALHKAGEKSGERLWRLPIDDGYKAQPKIADLNNDGNPYGGASTAAVFLKHFAGETPWAHLDIAGVAFADKIPGGLDVKGATGFGVNLLVNYYEQSAKK